MSAPSLASPESVSADFLPPLTVVRGRGRPPTYSPEVLAAACGLIREQGLTDTEAGALVGIPKATLSRWKAADEEIALALQQARAEHALKLIREVRDACDRGGRPQWRAAAWLLARMHPEDYGTPAQREKARALREREEEKERREYEKWLISSENASEVMGGGGVDSEKEHFRSENADPSPEEFARPQDQPPLVPYATASEAFRSASLRVTLGCVGAVAPRDAEFEKARFSSENAVMATGGEATENEKRRFSSKNPSPNPEELEALHSASLGVTGRWGAGAPGDAECEKGRFSSKNAALGDERTEGRIGCEDTRLPARGEHRTVCHAEPCEAPPILASGGGLPAGALSTNGRHRPGLNE